MAATRIDIDRILCPVDFSEFSEPAVERAVRLGDWFDARVEVLHVIPVPADLALPYFPVPLEVSRAQHEQAEQEIADLVEPFLRDGVPIATKVLEGDASQLIKAEAAALPADLLVVGTHGRSGFEHLLLGSVSKELLRRAPCPVLSVGPVAPHSRTGPLFRRILCAADLTEASEGTLAVALSLARENDARITLLHVVESLPEKSGAQLYLALPEIAPMRHDLVEQARTRLRKAVPDTVLDLCRVSQRVETGAAWREILRVAEELDAELIVIGTHDRGSVDRMIFGSTVGHVVRRATCPVLVIHERSKRWPAAEAAEAVGAGAGRAKGAGR